MKPGFELTHAEVELPFSVTELWQNFFADEGDYSFDNVNEALGIEENYQSAWTTTGELYEGRQVLKKQVA